MLLHGPVCAEVKLPGIFGSGMVIQRDQPVRIWGWAAADEVVTVTLNRQNESVRTNKNGTWLLALNPMPAGGPYEMDIHGNNIIQV